MRVTQIIADRHVTDLEAGNGFYSDYLELTEEEFNLGWVARYTSPDTGINLQLMTRDATAPENPVISVRVDDVTAAYAQAQDRGYEIVHPLTTEEWGVTRFFVRANSHGASALTSTRKGIPLCGDGRVRRRRRFERQLLTACGSDRGTVAGGLSSGV
jgi:predicted enzyme related to lactoylglutathione lyase